MKEMMRSKLSFLKNVFDVREDSEQQDTIVENVKRNIDFKGANLWTLMFAVLIASIGLNINSVVLIIGAMLISPLMGPIVGLGLSIGINDSGLLKQSLKNLGIATVISIIISTLYFLLSPISNVQSEFFARTSPTIYDILVAFFGGLAGIIGSTRLHKGNVIPGVAIATALMPPLCTVGYGIATGQAEFYVGALYLYAINCIFICLATLLGVKYLHLKAIRPETPEQAIRTRRIITAVVLVMIIPATYFAYLFVEENNFNKNANAFVQNAFENKGYTVIYKKLTYKSSPHTIEVAFLSKQFTQAEINALKNELSSYHLANTELVIKQGKLSLTEEQWNTAISSLRDEAEKVQVIEAKLSAGFVSSEGVNQVLKDVQIIIPKVTKLSIGTLPTAEGAQATASPELAGSDVQIAVVYGTAEDPLTSLEKQTLVAWLQSRMQNDSLVVLFQ